MSPSQTAPLRDPAAAFGAAEETVITGAVLVLPEETVRGSVVLRGGVIAEVDQGRGVPRGAVDCEGDLLAPGLVELHTDNLERHLEPRPGVAWPARAAIAAHDAELAGCGVTTVFDAVRLGSITSNPAAGYGEYARALVTEIHAMREAGALRLDHRLHLRAEINSETLEEELARFGPEDGAGIVSLMDHTPGQRQFRDTTSFERFMRDRHGMDRRAIEAYVAHLKDLQARLGARHEAAAVEAARRCGAVIASHDDTTEAHVAASAAHGAVLAEFPTTLEAARACREAGIAVMMGAPNLMRGGSHSGNVAAEALAREGLLDVLSSDYVPRGAARGRDRLGRDLGRHGARAAMRHRRLRARGGPRGPRPDRAGPARRPRAGGHPRRRAHGARRLVRRAPHRLKVGGCGPRALAPGPDADGEVEREGQSVGRAARARAEPTGE